MIIVALLMMGFAFFLSAFKVYEEWSLYQRNSLQQWDDKKRVLLHSLGHAVIMGVLAGAIHTIMFGGFQ